ncbi:uncharacterized protein LOC122076760 isoform X1 [Macadamia integrifolia]|uniref:uncharacterized protein LOC122076760 isoform X1 n=1 Tax=Macadamia integrifolia TaxID=60698 RepID=UPI001C4F7B0C|nr:uncharacterized protein LOC122076760 isoform X1 [Macadamia integrifolia]XP_042498207.1 uncharacterized protein LOC122076760 isoform X1 [Macadamia integrifolia]
MEKAIGLLRRSFGLIRSFSSSAPASNAATVVVSKKPKRRKKKNFFEVAQFLPKWGVGYQMANSHWVGVLYQITKMNLYKDGRHGKAWGIVYKNVCQLQILPKKLVGFISAVGGAFQIQRKQWRTYSNRKLRQLDVSLNF